MASTLFSSSVSLLFSYVVVLAFCTLQIHGGTDPSNSYYTIRVDSLFAAGKTGNCSIDLQGDDRDFSLKVTHRHGACSPLPETDHAHLRDFLLQDQLRVDSLQHPSTIPTTSTDVTLPARQGLALGTGNYIVTVGYGTPRRDLTVVFDTGSDLSWIQCQPCAGFCYPQQDPIFDPSKSTTHANVTCDSPYCAQLRRKTCARASDTCVYNVVYGDRSFSSGLLVLDTLTLTPSDVFPHFLFGCGQNNRGLFRGYAGLLGLSRTNLSIVSQTSRAFGGVFSYCLPSSSYHLGYLTFGSSNNRYPSDITCNGNVSYTPLLSSPRPDLYSVNMTGVSVMGQPLDIPPTVFSHAGTVVDSGTVVTRLPRTAYEALREAYRAGLAEYPRAPPLAFLDTCFDFSGHEAVAVPRVTMHFDGGVDVVVDPSGLFVAERASQVCLAIAGNANDEDIGIVGNMQQRRHEVVFDVGNGRLGFGDNWGCN
ncbi:Protein ASPARTIC PROTEASE IN GUARD CELL 2 [Acorus gramineus]|uniref:Protein ASPARTIC PROTEASE IN GUARD CELL 2 n=1 Tax=Acorus gramineus TaxID=55184 RepID=A0AAV9AW56_ACOGR|nr:Protein ASPARTIC PROTEASE IN GUARD CELL 2 [Acorus gramineus]